jgi:hypothetical protein
MESIYNFCSKLNPNEKNCERDSGWFREQWNELKKNITVAHARFNKSGIHINLL